MSPAQLAATSWSKSASKGRGTTVKNETPVKATPLKSCLAATKSPHSPDLKVTKAVAQLKRNEFLSPETVDHLLALFPKDYDPGAEVLSASFFNLEMMNYNRGKQACKHLVAPIHHLGSQPHWSLVRIFRDTAQGCIQVQHYDPIPNKGRSESVQKKIKSWVDDHEPSHEFKFEALASFPTTHAQD
ncbi:hypothetical protein F66182_2345 [Fusarium sp. NRRL 66182]|nr:hypothetical protein F66182_2345 [Fusarium sp. NRRL 66182]